MWRATEGKFGENSRPGGEECRGGQRRLERYPACGRTSFRGEDRLVLDESFNPCEDVVDVLGCWKLDAFPRRVDPGVVHPSRGVSIPAASQNSTSAPWASGHRWVVLDRAELGHDRVEEVEVVEEVDDCRRGPRSALRLSPHSSAEPPQ